MVDEQSNCSVGQSALMAAFRTPNCPNGCSRFLANFAVELQQLAEWRETFSQDFPLLLSAIINRFSFKLAEISQNACG